MPHTTHVLALQSTLWTVDHRCLLQDLQLRGHLRGCAHGCLEAVDGSDCLGEGAVRRDRRHRRRERVPRQRRHGGIGWPQRERREEREEEMATVTVGKARLLLLLAVLTR